MYMAKLHNTLPNSLIRLFETYLLCTRENNSDCFALQHVYSCFVLANYSSMYSW